MTVKRLNATKWMVEVPFVGAVFVGKEDDCRQYISDAMNKETRFRYENITQRPDFISYQKY